MPVLCAGRVVFAAGVEPSPPPPPHTFAIVGTGREPKNVLQSIVDCALDQVTLFFVFLVLKKLFTALSLVDCLLDTMCSHKCRRTGKRGPSFFTWFGWGRFQF